MYAFMGVRAWVCNGGVMWCSDVDEMCCDKYQCGVI